MELESFSALDEGVTKEDWQQTPAAVRRLLRWLLESYGERLADLEEVKALSKVESEILVEGIAQAPVTSVKPKGMRCSFCGKKREEVKKLIAGPDVHICNECVEICDAILDDDDM